MRNVLFILMAFGWSLSAQDLYVTFDDVASGTFHNNIGISAISRINGSAVAYSTIGTAGKVTVESGGMGAVLHRPVTIGVLQYPAQSFTKHLLVKADDTVSTPQHFTWTFAASRKASYGFFITISNFTGLGSFYTVGGLKTGSDYTVLSIVNDSPPFFQNEGITSPYGENIDVQNNLLIWVTGIWDSAQASAANRSRMYFYNATNMVLLGFSIDPFVTQNDTVNTFTYGIDDAHTKDAGTVYRLGPVLLWTNGTTFPVWPGGNLRIPTNASPAAFTQAHTEASNGDSIILPGTNTTWTSGVTVSKNNLNISGIASGGMGTNFTVIIADGAFDAFTVSGTLNTISNFQVRGDLSNDENEFFHNTGPYNRYSRLLLREASVAMYAEQAGLMDNCVVVDCNFMSRNIWGNSFYDSLYPLAWDSTNTFVYEDNKYYWTSAKNTTGSRPMMSSQQGDSWIVRHCYFEFNNASTDPAPVFDFHGDSPGLGRPGVALQIYSNYYNFLAGSVSGQKFVDIRGTRSLIYSNKFVGGSYDSGQGISYREEDVGESPNYIVNNSYAWENYDGTTGTDAFPISDDANITAGVDYFTTPLTPLVRLGYPHPLRNETPLTPGHAVPISIGIGRGVRIVSP